MNFVFPLQFPTGICNIIIIKERRKSKNREWGNVFMINYLLLSQLLQTACLSRNCLLLRQSKETQTINFSDFSSTLYCPGEKSLQQLSGCRISSMTSFIPNRLSQKGIRKKVNTPFSQHTWIWGKLLWRATLLNTNYLQRIKFHSRWHPERHKHNLPELKTAFDHVCSYCSDISLVQLF